MPRSHGIVVDRALWRLDVAPDRQGRNRFERRNVVAYDRGGERLHLFALRHILDEFLARCLVLREGPHTPEIWTMRHQPSLRATRIGEGPAILGHLWRIALGHRPGRGRVP